MITATLCTTDKTEPWAANVPFKIDGASWSASLNKAYQHYQNILSNPNAVIVYRSNDLEIIAKTTATIVLEDSENAKLKLETHWLRLVENGKIKDFEDQDQIASTLSSRL